MKEEEFRAELERCGISEDNIYYSLDEDENVCLDKDSMKEDFEDLIKKIEEIL